MALGQALEQSFGGLGPDEARRHADDSHSLRSAGGVLRFSELERALPDVSQKMLTQQLRALERDGIVERKVYPQVPPKVEYSLTEWGQAMCPALDALLEWGALRPKG